MTPYLIASEKILERICNSRLMVEGLLVESRIVLEAEEFIERVLEAEPDKVQLHFNLGMINHHGKGDNKQAEAHFRRFLSETEEGKFEQQRRITNMYLSTITHGEHRING